jgi:hypothetical protein
MLQQYQRRLLERGEMLAAEIPSLYGEPAWIFVEPKPAENGSLSDAFWTLPVPLRGKAFEVTECEIALPPRFSSPAYRDGIWYRSATVFGFDELERYLLQLGYNLTDLMEETRLNHPF